MGEALTPKFSVPRLMLVAICLITLFFFATILTVIISGEQAAPNLTLGGFVDGCHAMQQTCWEGVVLGTTTISEARQDLLTMGYQAGISDNVQHFQYFYSNQLIPGCVKFGYLVDIATVDYLSLSCWRNTSIGDALTRLGTVRSANYSLSSTGNIVYLSYLRNGSYSVPSVAIGSGLNSPFSPISSLDLFYNTFLDRNNPITWRWQGFLPLWRYCQIVPKFPQCS